MIICHFTWEHRTLYRLLKYLVGHVCVPALRKTQGINFKKYNTHILMNLLSFHVFSACFFNLVSNDCYVCMKQSVKCCKFSLDSPQFVCFRFCCLLPEVQNLGLRRSWGNPTVYKHLVTSDKQFTGLHWVHLSKVQKPSHGLQISFKTIETSGLRTRVCIYDKCIHWRKMQLDVEVSPPANAL